MSGHRFPWPGGAVLRPISTRPWIALEGVTSFFPDVVHRLFWQPNAPDPFSADGRRTSMSKPMFD